MLQVNPLAETTDGRLMAADAKLGFDDNAAFRQKELFAKRDTTQEDPRSAYPVQSAKLLVQITSHLHCHMMGYDKLHNAGLRLAAGDGKCATRCCD